MGDSPMRCVVVSCCNVSPIARSGSALAQAVEDLPIQHFIAEAGVEALAIAILLGWAGLDISCPGADSADPIPDGQGYELWPIVEADESRHATQDEQVGQCNDYVCRVQFAPHPDRQAFAAELVKNVQRPKHPAIINAAMNEATGPDMIPAFRQQPKAGAIVQPQTALLR